MKRFITSVLLGLGVCHSAPGAPSPIYANYGTISAGSAPVIDAIGFYNAGSFNLNTISSFSNFNNSVGIGEVSIPYSTKDTEYYTNTTSGTISGTPGFRFDDVSSTKRGSARQFINHGMVTGVDTPATADYFSTTAGTTALPEYSQPVASQLLIYTTNIFNDGTLEVGNYGLLHMEGLSISNNNGNLVAGAINTGGTSEEFTNLITVLTNLTEYFTVDPLDTTGDSFSYINPPYFVDPPFVYDLLWGATNGGKVNLALTTFPPINITSRGSGAAISIFDFGNASSAYTPYVYSNTFEGTNIYYNVVLVDTNFSDSNLFVNVAFGGYDGTIFAKDDGNDPNTINDIVQFGLTTYDVISGQTVTNAVYLLDDGASLTNASLFDNASSADNYARPEMFDITTSTPESWEFASPANGVYDSTILYNPGDFVNTTVPYFAAEYEAQIGRNVENVAGTFDGFGASLPDPTNEACRIEINARNLDLTRARVRSEGMVIINATNLVGGTNVFPDWGEANALLGATNGSLIVSNFFPTTFQRVRGAVDAYAITYQNVYTNATLTNVFHYHVLVVGQDLRGNFHSSIRNLTLQGKKSVNILDPLYVVNKYTFETTNLYINSTVQLTGNAGNLTSTNMPILKNFYNDTNGILTVDSVAAFGFNPNAGESAIVKRKYSVLSVTNLGQITATAPLFDSAVFENDGTITADNNGSIVIEAGTLGLGLALTNVTNTLVAAGNVTLSAPLIEATKSQIYAGGVAGTGIGGSLVLQTTSGGKITDFVSGAPSTNTALVNYWQVTGGFSLPVKPATGDLFGTQIKTIANGSTVANHIWAGADLGPTPEGFANNVVIGHLTLSRQTNTALLQFSGAGAQNGMYVDYLELDPNSLSYGDYQTGLVIDPNLTIYFADANVDPLKLEIVYSNRLVWVPNFSGPNSTVAVPYENSSNVCLLNAALAFSPDVSFFGNVPNEYNQPYVLNNPSNPTDTYPCPGETTAMKSFIVKTGLTNESILTVSTMGEGTITPTLKANKVFIPGETYTFAAHASPGWYFSGWTVPNLTGVATNTATLKFSYQTNVTIITANFTPDPFTLIRGTYHGLFFDTNSPLPSTASSGFFTFGLVENGAFSGRLMMGSAIYPFSSKFTTNGAAYFTVRHGGQLLDVSLQLDMSAASGQVHGYVSNELWNVQLQGDLAPDWTLKDPSPLAGRYNIAISPGTNGIPGGYGYGSLDVTKAGLLSVAGRLGDGTPFSQSVPISKSGEWPFYAAAGRDLVLGWVVFQPNSLAVTNISGTNFWSKSSGGLYYSGGFTNTFGLTGSPYSSNDHPFTTNATVTLNGGTPITVTNRGNLTYEGEGLTFSIKPATGNFSGRFGTNLLNGVLLQNQDDARGFYLRTNESGSILIQAR